MQPGDATELLLIRHAPALHGGRLAGRRDVAADCSDQAAIGALRGVLAGVEIRVTSPALRCRQTAAALWPGAAPPADPRLWEQDFGTWEGCAFDRLPDLGALSLADLAVHSPPEGESFAAVCARTEPVFAELAGRGGRIAVVVHAGVVRAGLAFALGSVPAALAFHVAPLSLTRIRVGATGHCTVLDVNRIAG